MTEQQSNRADSSFLRALGAISRFLLRLLFVLIVGLLLGAGLYYGVPWAYRNLVQPVQQNSTRLAALERRMDEERGRLQEENRALQDRIAALETELAQVRDEAAVQAQGQEALSEWSQETDARLAQIESDLADQQESTDAMQSAFEDALTELGQEMEKIAKRTDESQERLNAVQGQMVLLQTAQDLLKARLLLIEENALGARETTALAVEHLDRAIALMPAQAETLQDLRERTAALDELIARRSFRVRPDLEALWADLIDLIVSPSAPSEAPQSPLPTPTPTS